jgi:hypothetical protein
MEAGLHSPATPVLFNSAAEREQFFPSSDKLLGCVDNV